MNTSKSNTAAQAAQALATLAVTNPQKAVFLLAKAEEHADEMLRHLVTYPGAIEALLLADSTPRWMKATLRDVAEEGGYTLLT